MASANRVMIASGRANIEIPRREHSSFDDRASRRSVAALPRQQAMAELSTLDPHFGNHG